MARQRARRHEAGTDTPALRLADALHKVGGPLRASSLIVTVFGDIVAPRGGSLWLGTLQEILQPLGIDDGNVRTALSRLVADGWLERARIGRNSFFTLTPAAASATRDAAARIYGAPPVPAVAGWTLGFPRDGQSLAALRPRPEPVTAGSLAGAIVWAGQGVRPQALADALLFIDVPSQGAARDAAIARQGWPLEPVASQYRRLIEAFGPTGGIAPSVAGAEAASLRVLIVHELRRAALRDPWLPEAALGADWPGRQAREICRSHWRLLLQPSEAWLDKRGQGSSGALPARVDGISGW